MWRTALRRIKQETRAVEVRYDSFRTAFANPVAAIGGNEWRDLHQENFRGGIKLYATDWNALYRTQMGFLETCAKLAVGQSQLLQDYLELLVRSLESSAAAPARRAPI